MVNGCRLRASRERSVSLATATFFMYSTISSYRSAWLGVGLGVSKGAGEGGTSVAQMGSRWRKGRSARPPGAPAAAQATRVPRVRRASGRLATTPSGQQQRGRWRRRVRAPARLASPCKHHPWLPWSIV